MSPVMHDDTNICGMQVPSLRLLSLFTYLNFLPILAESDTMHVAKSVYTQVERVLKWLA